MSWSTILLEPMGVQGQVGVQGPVGVRDPVGPVGIQAEEQLQCSYCGNLYAVHMGYRILFAPGYWILHQHNEDDRLYELRHVCNNRVCNACIEYCNYYRRQVSPGGPSVTGFATTKSLCSTGSFRNCGSWWRNTPIFAMPRPFFGKKRLVKKTIMTCNMRNCRFDVVQNYIKIKVQ